MSLLVILLLATTTGLDVLALNAAGTATSERRVEGELNVRLFNNTDHEGWNVDDLAADTAKGRRLEKLHTTQEMAL